MGIGDSFNSLNCLSSPETSFPLFLPFLINLLSLDLVTIDVMSTSSQILVSLAGGNGFEPLLTRDHSSLL